MKKIHMVGIGGIGLSALAQLYTNEGAEVSGSDRSESPTTEMLRAKGISVHIGQRVENVPMDIELLVYSDAIPEDNAERVRGRELGVRQISYFEALGEVAKSYRVVAVAGTHGKTTVTAMLGKVLIDAGLDPTVVVGSIVPEWGSNFHRGHSGILVVEACEYREHFLHFRPEILVITNVEWDHTDYFKNFDEFKSAFDKMRTRSKTVIDQDTYSKESAPELSVPGEFNKDNARAAKAAVRVIAPDISGHLVDRSLADFKGTWRRFEFKGTLPNGAKLYDDYAHHPTAIEKTIQAARGKFPDKKIVVFFHPHLYSRTRDLFGDFAKALSTADETYVLPVYAAREPHDPAVTNESLAQKINKLGGRAQALERFEEVEKILRGLSANSVAFTMGAGDVYKAGENALR